MSTSSHSHSFLVKILGLTGADALAKAAKREPGIGSVLVPRAALAWLEDKNDFEGILPGISDSYLKFEKSENGYKGIVTLPDVNYTFNDASIEHVAASIAIAVGSISVSSRNVPNVTLDRLGRSIDVLVKAESFAVSLKKSILNVNDGYDLKDENTPTGLVIHAFDKKGKHVGTAWFEHNGTELKPISLGVNENHEKQGLAHAIHEHAKKISGKHITDTYKTELPGQTAKPQPQLAPVAPMAPQAQSTGKQAKPKLPKVKLKIPAMKVEKSEINNKCPECDGTQFLNGKFKGCICFTDLAKSVKTLTFSDGLVLEFSDSMNRDAIPILRKALKGY